MKGGESTAKQKYYRITNIEKTKAQYRILLGERSNGKSYAVKEHCLLKAYEKGNEFALLRRYKQDVRESDIEAYFADMPIYSITSGEYDIISVYRGSIYFAKIAEDGKIVRGKKCGHIFYLSGNERFKSQAFPYITDIIFEEFVTNKMYLPNEPSELQHFISTIARRRLITVWLIGNTISRVCPYYVEWGLKNIPYQQQGTIDVYEFATNQIDDNGKQIIVKIAVENCANSGNNSKMFFGKTGEQITSGQWETKEQPHLLRDYSEYEMLYELLFNEMNFNFVIQLLINKDGGIVTYIYPFTKKRNIKRVVTSVFSDSPFVTKYLREDIYAERMIKECLIQGKVCFSDNLTGCDFIQILENRKGGL